MIQCSEPLLGVEKCVRCEVLMPSASVCMRTGNVAILVVLQNMFFLFPYSAIYYASASRKVREK